MPNTPPPRRPKAGGWSPLDGDAAPDVDGDTRPAPRRRPRSSDLADDAAPRRAGQPPPARGDDAPPVNKRPRPPMPADAAERPGGGAGVRPRWQTRDRDRGPERGSRWSKGPPRPSVAIAGDDRLFIFGSHAVEAALANPRRTIRKVWLTDNASRRLAAALEGRAFDIESVTPRDLDKRLGADTVHQGALIEADALPDVELIDLIAASGEAGAAPLPMGPIVVLDQVTDPHNVGAILRSAAVFGARGVVMTRRHSPPLGGALAKAASGALDQVAVALVQNLAKALSELAEAGVMVVGLDGDAETLLEDVPFAGPTAIVLGAEGKGLRELTRASCTVVARIAADGPLGSLNVSNAAAISLHFAAFRRRSSPAKGSAP